jgi:hypothetical protein
MAKAKKALSKKLKPIASDDKLADVERVVTEILRYFTDAGGHTHNPVQQPWMANADSWICVCI